MRIPAVPVSDPKIKNCWIFFITPVVLYGFLVVNGWLGANFGFHWDEHIFVEFVDDFHNHGRIIPTFFLWPSFCFYLTLFASGLFRLFHPELAGVPSLLQNTDFTVFVRCIFVLVASLTVVWVYWLAFKLTRKYWYALLAGLIFCSSFEFSYHSRWAVSDLIAVQFATLSTLMLFLDMSLAKRIGWSAFIAGVAAGTKYTAGIVILNTAICLAVHFQPWRNAAQARPFLRQLVLIGSLFAIAFIITTPGCIYHMKTFAGSIRVQKNIYAGGHMIWDTVNPGWEHFSKIIAYVVLTLFSPVPAVSAFVSLLTLAGAAHACLKKNWLVFGMFLTMTLYIVYVSRFKVMIVRNVQYVLPYFVVLAAYGIFSIHERFKHKSVRVLDAAVLCMVALSLKIIVADSWSIYRKDDIDQKRELAFFLAAHPQGEFIFSNGVRRLLTGPNPAIHPGLDGNVSLVFLKDEVNFEDYAPIGFHRYQTIAGPRDVNFDYYPDWSGADRIVIMKLKDANQKMLEDLGLPMNH